MAVPDAAPGMRLTGVDRLVVAAGAAALCAWTVAVTVVVSRASMPPPWPAALVAALVILSQLPGLRIARRFGPVGSDVDVDVDVATLLVGFVVLGPAWFVVLAGPAVLAVRLALHTPRVRALYDASAYTASAGAAYGAVALVGIPPTWASATGVLVLALAAITLRMSTRLARAGYVAVTTHRAFAGVLRGRPTVDLALVVANGVLAAAVLFVVYAESAAVLLVPLALVSLALAGRVLVAGHQERQLAAELERGTAGVNQLDELDIAEAALSVVGSVFGCASAELQLMGDRRRPPRRYEAGADGAVVCRPGAAALTDPARRDGIVVPLRGPMGEVGQLWLRPSAGTTLNRRQWSLLRAFGQTVGLAVINAALSDDLRVEAARQAYEATHDSLTGLANRALLQERIRAAVQVPHDLTTALLLLDIDHFKEINDTIGHAAGDFLLQRVGDRLSTLDRRGDLISRLGGDEFAVLLTGLESPDAAGTAADEVLRLLTEPVSYEGMRLSVEASVGLACYPADAADADELLRRAEVAMYQAKSDRGSCVRYELRHDGSSVDRLALVAELRSALERDEIIVHYQPQADLATGEVVGVEALARWEHPSRGRLMPAEFIGVAEQSGLVRPFTLRVLDLAVAECAGWQAAGRNATVAVNLAARSLLDRQLPVDVASVLARHSLPPDRLVLEITESTAASEIEAVEEVLGRLRRLGVAVSVDDFGTGYSSLAFLQRTKVNELKVDRSFVRGILESESDVALVRATVQLAHSLGARAVAEGVEDGRLASALRDLGCDLGQGYWLSRPVPAEEIRVLLGATVAQAFSLPQPRAEQPRPVTHLRAVEG